LEEICYAADELRIFSFSTISESQSKPWRRRAIRFKPIRNATSPDLRSLHAEFHPPLTAWLDRPAARLSFFTLGVLAFISILLLFVPSATISLEPAPQIQELMFQVNASPDVAEVNLAGSLPVRVHEIIVEGDKTTLTTGQTMVPENPAYGMASFRNLTASVIDIPAGTVICTRGEPAVKFTTNQDGVLLGGVNNTIDIPIKAYEPGLSGNLEAGALIAIEGNLGGQVAVTNPDPTYGGTEHMVNMPNVTDRTHLRDLLLADLRQKVLEQFSDQLASSDLLFPGTLVLTKVLAETYQPAEGLPGEILRLSLRVEFSIQYIRAADLNELASAALDAGKVEDWHPVNETTVVEMTGNQVYQASGGTSFEIHASRMLFPNINVANVARAVQGLPLEKANQRLEAMLPLTSSPVIELFPSWWPWLPLLQFRIMITIR